jgi:prepilin-type N-terminal cleavage/methylation domain-containing protein
MRLHRSRPPRRGGFTLIELLVVIAIIAILISLTTASVFWVFVKMDEVKTRTELNQMQSAVKQFESDFNISKPPPGRLMLDESGVYDAAAYPGYANFTPAQQAALQRVALDSKNYIRSVWPRIQYPIDWNGDNVRDPNTGALIPNSIVILEGQQSLVFWLGGVVVNGTPTGFSTDTTNPVRQGGNRKGPYFQFDPRRLQAAGGGFPQYLDPYGALPYAYFSSGKGQNHYGDYADIGYDCPSLGVSPYFDTAGHYHHPDTFQIISAGRNKQFGPGGQWSPSTGAAIGPAGRDDISNFYDKLMGTQQ